MGQEDGKTATPLLAQMDNSTPDSDDEERMSPATSYPRGWLSGSGDDDAWEGQRPGFRRWDRGLLDVGGGSIAECAYGCVCPALLFADARGAEGLSQSSWWESMASHIALDALSVLLIVCIWPVFVPVPFSLPLRTRERGRLRRELGIEGTVARDCLAHTFCYPCALLQEYREARHAFAHGTRLGGPPENEMQ